MNSTTEAPPHAPYLTCPFCIATGRNGCLSCESRRTAPVPHGQITTAPVTAPTPEEGYPSEPTENASRREERTPSPSEVEPDPSEAVATPGVDQPAPAAATTDASAPEYAPEEAIAALVGKIAGFATDKLDQAESFVRGGAKVGAGQGRVLPLSDQQKARVLEAIEQRRAAFREADGARTGERLVPSGHSEVRPAEPPTAPVEAAGPDPEVPAAQEEALMLMRAIEAGEREASSLSPEERSRFEMQMTELGIPASERRRYLGRPARPAWKATRAPVRDAPPPPPAPPAGEPAVVASELTPGIPVLMRSHGPLHVYSAENRVVLRKGDQGPWSLVLRTGFLTYQYAGRGDDPAELWNRSVQSEAK